MSAAEVHVVATQVATATSKSLSLQRHDKSLAEQEVTAGEAVRISV